MKNQNQNVTWEEIEWMLEEKRLELIEDAKYLEFIIEEMKKIREKYNDKTITFCANHCFL